MPFFDTLESIPRDFVGSQMTLSLATSAYLSILQTTHSAARIRSVGPIAAKVKLGESPGKAGGLPMINYSYFIIYFGTSLEESILLG